MNLVEREWVSWLDRGEMACPWCGSGELAPALDSVTSSAVRCGSCQRLTEICGGIWSALGAHRPARTIAQFANSIPPETWFYEMAWRRSASKRFSNGAVSLEAELAELHAALSLDPGDPVVDLGCSEGLYARRLAQTGARAYAVDHSRRFLRAARRRARHEGVGGSVLPTQAVAQHLPFVNGSMAAVAIGGTLNEIGDRALALAETRRVLRGGGKLFSMSLVPAHNLLGRGFQRSLGATGIHFPSVETVTSEMEAAGLSVMEARCDGVLLRVTATKSA
jgi:SAM-dependent methyltransferase